MNVRLVLCLVASVVGWCGSVRADDGLYQRYMTHALQGDLAPMIGELLNPDSNLSEKDTGLVDKFAARFGPAGRVEEPETDQPFVHDIVTTYREFWADVLLHEYSEDTREEKITSRVKAVLEKYGVEYPDTVSPLEQVSLEFEKLGYRALTGVTLPHFDLLSWGNNEAVDYKIELTDDTTTVRVYFMSDFVSFGWSHYATFGAAYPGGWATSDALYCMSDDYDRSSEKFRISYLKHEGRHFADYLRFPALQQADLEYRAKLTELVYADTTLYDIIDHFSKNAARNASAPHSLANHELVGRLSKAIFGETFVAAGERWRSVDADRIHSEAAKLLALSTRDLTDAGADTVQGLIHP